MERDDLLDRVRLLRARRYSPAEIARALNLSKGEASRLVRAIASESETRLRDAADEDSVVRDRPCCWVSPGWRHGLRVDGHADWPGYAAAPAKARDSGVAIVLVAREDGFNRMSVCSYLVDTWCLGVKNAIAPRRMARRELEAFRRHCFEPWGSDGIPVPLELAQHLVLGAVEYARHLGFEPHRDFARARPLLGAWLGPSAIYFGRDGTPYYVNGPYENPRRVLSTLERHVGQGRFHYAISAGGPVDLDDQYVYDVVLTD
jgi:hypothetical protein